MDTRMLGSRFGLVRRAVVGCALGALLAAVSVPTLSASAAGCGACNDDADGLTNYEEYALYGTNPDTDFDGITDSNEVYAYGTSPLNADTDFDGLLDGDEVYFYGTNPLVPYGGSGNGYGGVSGDQDGDGLGDHDGAYIYGTSPVYADTDGDGWSDGAEIARGTNPLNFHSK